MTAEEFVTLRCQIGTSKKGRGGRRFLPYVFTEQGVAMLSSVLASPHAIQVNIAIMRAFVRLRYARTINEDLAGWMRRIERELDRHDGAIEKHTTRIRAVFAVIQQLMDRPDAPGKKIGFSDER